VVMRMRYRWSLGRLAAIREAVSHRRCIVGPRHCRPLPFVNLWGVLLIAEEKLQSWLGAPSARLATFFWVSLKLWEMFQNSCRSDGFVARDKMRWSGELCHPVCNSVRTWRCNLKYTLTKHTWRVSAFTRLRPRLPCEPWKDTCS
jgi:hypothetical protein